jgi:hypothetical protein
MRVPGRLHCLCGTHERGWVMVFKRHRTSFMDRTGREHTREEMAEIFLKLYRVNLNAILLMFPDLNRSLIKHYAGQFGMLGPAKCKSWRPDEIEIARKLWPDYRAISEATGRSYDSVKGFCVNNIGKKRPIDPAYTPEEEAMVRSGVSPPGRSACSIHNKCTKLGIQMRYIRAVRRLGPGELTARVSALVGAYPHDRRPDIIQAVMAVCMEGKCSPKEAALRAEIKRAVTATYKLHPDRGAPTSLNAQIYDDGGTTVGDRIASDAFHF